MNCRVRTIIIGLGTLGIVGSGAGISAATVAHKAPKTATACLDARHGLLAPTGGRCAKGLTLVHVPLSTIKGAPGAAGVQGPAGAQGPTGAQGSAGASGISQYQLVQGTAVTISASTESVVSVSCPSGLSVLGGGISVSSTIASSIESSYPVSTGWSGAVFNSAGGSITATAWATCAKVSS